MYVLPEHWDLLFLSLSWGPEGHLMLRCVSQCPKSIREPLLKNSPPVSMILSQYFKLRAKFQNSFLMLFILLWPGKVLRMCIHGHGKWGSCSTPSWQQGDFIHFLFYYYIYLDFILIFLRPNQQKLSYHGNVKQANGRQVMH